MVYLLGKFKPEEIDLQGHQYANCDFWESPELRVKALMRNNRNRTPYTKQQMLDFFNITDKLQIVQSKEIKPKPHDQMIFWTEDRRFFILQVREYIN